MNHINNGQCELLEKDPTAKVKPKTLKQLNDLKDNKFINNKLYYYIKSMDFLNTHKYASQEKPQRIIKPHETSQQFTIKPLCINGFVNRKME